MKLNRRMFTASTRFATLALTIALALTMVIPLAQAQTLTVLHNFTNGQDGATPYAGLTMDKAGNLYGTTLAGGKGENGTVFKLTHKGSGWTFSPLYNFLGGSDGQLPEAGVVFGPDGSLYGTTLKGGDPGRGSGCCGTVYKLRPSAAACRTALCPWTETVVYPFTAGDDGEFPRYGNVVFDPAGNLYGTASTEGVWQGGTVYELSPSESGYWTENTLYPFKGGLDGSDPYSGVIFDPSGNLYGTTPYGCAAGTVYEVSPSGSGWTEQILNCFQYGGNGGEYPYGGLIFDQAGNLYGTTSFGGQNGGGTVFELTPSNGQWNLIVLYSFDVYPGPYSGVTMDAAGNLYGTTVGGGKYQYGTVFKLTKDEGWAYTDLHDFAGGSDGEVPIGGVVLDASGNLYGTTTGGGAGNGTVWELTP